MSGGPNYESVAELKMFSMMEHMIMSISLQATIKMHTLEVLIRSAMITSTISQIFYSTRLNYEESDFTAINRTA